MKLMVFLGMKFVRGAYPKTVPSQVEALLKKLLPGLAEEELKRLSGQRASGSKCPSKYQSGF